MKWIKQSALFPILAVLVSLILGLFLVSQAQPQPQPEREAVDFSYQKWEYEGWSGRGDANLTSHMLQDSGGSAYGWFLITSWEQYQDCMDIISKKLAEDPIITPQNKDERHRGFRYFISEDTLTREIDRAFFSDSWLIVVDFCHYGDLYLESSLDSVTTSDETNLVEVDVSESYLAASVRSYPGHLYWIQVPFLGDASLDVQFQTEVEPSPFYD